MDIDHYAQWAASVAVGRPMPLDQGQLLSYLALGLASEAGEIAGVVKKRLRDGHWDPDAVADELGDIAYYFARLCAVLGQPPSVLLDRSVAKIEQRIAAPQHAPF